MNCTVRHLADAAGRADCVPPQQKSGQTMQSSSSAILRSPDFLPTTAGSLCWTPHFSVFQACPAPAKHHHRLSATTEDATDDDQHADSADKTDIKKPLPEQEAVFLSGKHPLTGSEMQAFSLPAQQMPHRARLQLHRYPRFCGTSARPADRISPSHRSKRPVLPFARGKPSGVF